MQVAVFYGCKVILKRTFCGISSAGNKAVIQKSLPLIYIIYFMRALLLAFLLLPVVAGAQIISTVAGNGSLVYSGDSAAATNASFYYPMGVAVDATGNIYIADALNSVVRKVGTDGNITTVAGTGMAGFGGDGGPATADSAKLNSPAGLAVDIAGNLYIADAGNGRIRMITTFGTISTVAGGGSSTSDGSVATDYSLSAPAGIAFDGAGNMYLTDDGRVYKTVRPGAVTYINIIAGIGGTGFSGDGGPATAALFNEPQGIAVDLAGNVYVADKSNFRIRQINTSGTINSVAGNGDGAGSGFGAFSGDDGPAISAALNFPTGIAIAPGGSIYIADRNNNRIRLLTPSGTITTIAGNGTSGFGGDGGLAADAKLSAPGSVAVDVNGNLFIADELNNRIRKITGLGSFTGVNNLPAKPSSISVYPNPATDNFIVSGLNTSDRLCLYDAIGRQVSAQTATATQLRVDINGLTAGVYFLQVWDASGNAKGRVTIEKE